MLTINFSPVRSDDDSLDMFWEAPVLTVNGVAYDLSELDDGDRATGHPVLGDVERDLDDYTVKIRLPHGPNAPYSTRFPEPVVLMQNGDVPVPEWTKEVV